MSISVYILTVALLNLLQEEVVAQVLPPYGNVPVSYINNEEDDLGMLLAILLLAGRNKGGACGCCNCCNCGKPAQNIPIPFPIPFPTNNPIVTKSSRLDDHEEDDHKPRVKGNKGDERNIYIDVSETTDIDEDN